MTDPYDILAELYDAELAGFDADLDFWRSRARGRVLDLGCGTGRVSRYLRSRGIPVVGLDRSERMLERAVAHTPGVFFFRADMARFAVRGFANAIAAWSSFQFLLTREDRARCLACVRDALLPDGLLTIDLFAPVAGAPATSPRKLATEFAWEGRRVSKFESAKRAGGILSLRWEYLAAGKYLADVVQHVAILGRGEVERELEEAGFAVFAAWRDWRENPYADRGPRLIIDAARV